MNVKRTLVAALALVLVVGLAGAGTFAYFSDTETSIGNSFTAGTLDLEVGGQNPNSSPDFTLENVKPGDSGTVTYDLTNVGSIAGFLDLSGISVSDGPGATTEAEPTPDSGELSACVQVVVTLGGTTVYSGPLSSILEAYDLDVSLAAGGSTTLTIEWSVGESVGNEIQGDVATVGLTIELDQVAD